MVDKISTEFEQYVQSELNELTDKLNHLRSTWQGYRSTAKKLKSLAEQIDGIADEMLMQEEGGGNER